MAALQALPENECVLRADGDDEAEAEEEAGQGGGAGGRRQHALA